MNTEQKHTTIEDLWEQMSREDWLAGEGFSGKPGGLTKIPIVCRERIFEFAKAFHDLRAPELLQQVEALTKENEDLKAMNQKLMNDVSVLIEQMNRQVEDLLKLHKEFTDQSISVEEKNVQIKSLTEQVENLKDEIHQQYVTIGKVALQASEKEELSRLREREKELVEALKQRMESSDEYNNEYFFLEALLSKFDSNKE